MAVRSTVVSVATTATLLVDGTNASAQAPLSSVVSVPTGGATVFVGGDDVTTTNGLPVAAGTSLTLDLFGGDKLYGIVATGTQNTNVLRTRA